jgi:hypothetical protein
MRNLNTLRAGINLVKEGQNATEIRSNFSSLLTGVQSSLKRDRVQPATVNQLTNLIATSPDNDTYIYLENTGIANFDVRNAAADSGVFATLASGEFMFFRLQKAKDLYVKNLSSSDTGEVKISYWQVEENVE